MAAARYIFVYQIKCKHKNIHILLELGFSQVCFHKCFDKCESCENFNEYYSQEYSLSQMFNQICLQHKGRTTHLQEYGFSPGCIFVCVTSNVNFKQRALHTFNKDIVSFLCVFACVA